MVKSAKKRIRFERHPSQVVFDPSSKSFVVTWTKCGMPLDDRIAARRDPLSWIPSVSSIATLYDRGCIPQQCNVYAAMSIGRAWDAGDRESLDTEGARKAAELVRDLACMCVDMDSPSVARDVGQAMRHLLDEMAYVRFLALDQDELAEKSVMPSMEKASSECFSIPDFRSWPPQSMRRRMLYCLNRKECSRVAYTLVSLIFDVGACPLLSLSDRRVLRMKAASESGWDRSMSRENMMSFFRFALGMMSSARSEGRGTVCGKVTQQQLADSLTGSSS